MGGGNFVLPPVKHVYDDVLIIQLTLLNLTNMQIFKIQSSSSKNQMLSSNCLIMYLGQNKDQIWQRKPKLRARVFYLKKAPPPEKFLCKKLASLI